MFFVIFRVWYSWLILKMHAAKWCTKAATRIFHMMETSFSSLILDIVNLPPRYAKSISFHALLSTVTETYTLHYLWVKIWSLPNEQLKDNLFYCVEGGGNGIVIVHIRSSFFSFLFALALSSVGWNLIIENLKKVTSTDSLRRTVLAGVWNGGSDWCLEFGSCGSWTQWKPPDTLDAHTPFNGDSSLTHFFGLIPGHRGYQRWLWCCYHTKSHKWWSWSYWWRR